jgi:hypothetical protein
MQDKKKQHMHKKKNYVVVVYVVHPFKKIKYGDAYHTCGLALYVHRAGLEPCTSTFSS